MKQKCSVIIPVYNSSASLEELTRRLDLVLSHTFRDYEIIFVIDGSPDDSWKVIQALALQNNRIRAFNLMRNYGQHNALYCGIMVAKYELIATLDDDLQNPPEELPKLLKEIEKGFDVIYGTPQQEHHGLFRDLASVITKVVLSSILGSEQARYVGAYRLFRSDLRRAFENFHGPYVNIDVLLSWASVHIGSVQVIHEGRLKGKSSYTLRKLISHAINLITGFSVIPLRISSITGFFFAFVGIIILVYVLVRRLLFGVAVPGFTFLASMIAFFSGAMLFALGIIGEYLARMYFRIMDKPKFVIREAIDRPGNLTQKTSK
jgi:glycosyltransferase involved in cell wall biosynthesis